MGNAEKETAERIACLETDVGNIKTAINNILEAQEAARERDTKRQVSLGELSVRLDSLLARLDKIANARFNLANIIIGVCSVLVLVLNLLITMPAIENSNRIAREQMSTYSLTKP